MSDFNDSGDQTGARYQYQGQVNPHDPSLANGGISLAEWQAYQAKRKKDAILGAIGILGATTGLGALGGALSGAGGAAMASVPGAIGAEAAPLGMGSVAAGAAGLPSGVGAAAGMGAGAAGAGAAAGMGAATGTGMFAGMGAKDLLALGLGGAGLIGGAMSNPPDMQPNTSTTDPQLRELIALMSGRLKKSEPLFDSVQSMANGLLPTQYQKGGGGMG